MDTPAKLQDVIEILRNKYGISLKDLIRYGAELGPDGKIVKL